MALARDHQTNTCSLYGNFLEPGSSAQFQHLICPNYGFDQDYITEIKQDRDGLDNSPEMKMNTDKESQSPPLSSSSSANSNNDGFPLISDENSNQLHHQYQQPLSLINFKTGYLSTCSDASNFLNFQQLQQHHNQINIYTNNYPKLSLDEVNYEDDQWFYDAPQPQESGSQQTCLSKRTHLEEEEKRALKRQCKIGTSKKPIKLKSSSSSKDPQSIAAKNRRERISERLKILQDLVPNGSKVDMVTMLEKAIGYVKFLQLQMKVLATDEFWPAADGKAPDISQVREAIDVILSSQRSEKATNSISN